MLTAIRFQKGSVSVLWIVRINNETGSACGTRMVVPPTVIENDVDASTFVLVEAVTQGQAEDLATETWWNG
jgi:hypothetical protein